MDDFLQKGVVRLAELFQFENLSPSTVASGAYLRA